MAREHGPFIHKVAIGYERGAADQTFVESVKISGLLGPIFGLIENLHDSVDLTVAFKQSQDNGDADGFTGINMRVGGAAVASKVIKPKGKVVFALETLTEAWLKVEATTAIAGQGFGRLTMGMFADGLVSAFRES